MIAVGPGLLVGMTTACPDQEPLEYDCLPTCLDIRLYAFPLQLDEARPFSMHCGIPPRISGLMHSAYVTEYDELKGGEGYARQHR